MTTMLNGWQASRTLKTRLIEPVPGVKFVIVDNDDVAAVFTYLVQQFHARVDDVTKPHPMDDWSYYYKPNANNPTQLSNHARGVAIDLDATEHPNGVSTAKTFTAAQIAEIHEILDELDGAIRWGGDYTRTADAMHFEINVDPAAVRKVANKLRTKSIMVELTAISWNVYVKHPIDHVRAELKQMIKNQDPDVIVLYEAIRMFGHLDGLGYEVFQLGSQVIEKGNQPGTANVAILVKDSLRTRRKTALRMKTFWRGPNLGLAQDPRVFLTVKVVKHGVVWKVGGFHFPFGATARREAFVNTRRWFRKTLAGRPVIAFGDFNLNKARIAHRIGDNVDAKVAGQGIDLAIYKHCRLMKTENLGNHGSDHPAMKYVFRKRK